jgi:hypothetical protein
MKKLHLFIAILLNMLLLIACRKKDTTPALPPETQEGRTTFGCLINNKVFVNEGSYQFGAPSFYSVNLQRGINLNAFMIDAKQNISQAIGISIQQTIKVGLYSFNSSSCQASFTNGFKKSVGCYYTSDTTKDIGTLEITKYDTIQKILSGKFNFILHKIYHTTSNGDTIKGSCDSIITITQGRFDLRY